MSFSINCLEITATKEDWEKNKSLYKNLLCKKDYKIFEEEKVRKNETFKKRFFFNDFYTHNQHGGLEKNEKNHLNSNVFFGDGINIQAVVGKNGSGKSTLMDLMYMAINNFAFFFEQGKVRPGADELCYVQGLFLNLYFSVEVETETHEYKLECKEITKLLKREKGGWPIVGCASFRMGKINKYYKKQSDRPIISLVENFFYTIVSNYSMQSFISSNYIERTQDYAGRNRRRPWINSIFYKNDGYVRPIVLNPFRDLGSINLANEQNLSKDRASSLFVYSFYEDKNFFKPYDFFDLKIKYNSSIIREKINRIIVKNTEKKRIFRSEKSILGFIQNEITRDESFLHHLEKNFFFKLSVGTSEKTKICVAYVMFKIWNLTKKYVFYAPYADGIEYLEEGFVIKNKKILNALFRKINQDNSHVTKKIKRSLNYILVSKERNFKDSFNGTDYFNFLKKTYLNRIRKSERDKSKEYLYFKKNNPFAAREKLSFLSPSCVDLCLPPPIFSYELILKRNDLQRNEKIKYNNLSSGELQLLQTLSVHAYHISNLLSIQGKGRPQYRNINLVFDEVEICFHPEYQRNFINRFIEMANDMKWTSVALINVFVMTHSPFILSDIPVSRVLYMDEGSMKKDEDNSLSDKETFGQNIGSLLCNSFYLKYYVGDFARKKINEILDEFERNKSMPKDEFERKIQIFGDRLLKRQMMNYYESHKV